MKERREDQPLHDMLVDSNGDSLTGGVIEGRDSTEEETTPALIFDFDGVLGDSDNTTGGKEGMLYEAFVRVTNIANQRLQAQAAKRDSKRLSDLLIPHSHDWTAQQQVRADFQPSKIKLLSTDRDMFEKYFMGNWWESLHKVGYLPEDQEAMLRAFGEHCKRVKLFPGLVKIVPQLAQKRVLSIISSGNGDMIREKLAEYRIDAHFKNVWGQREGRGKGKTDRIRQLLRSPHDVYIGDTIGDMKESLEAISPTLLLRELESIQQRIAEETDKNKRSRLRRDKSRMESIIEGDYSCMPVAAVWGGVHTEAVMASSQKAAYILTHPSELLELIKKEDELRAQIRSATMRVID